MPFDESADLPAGRLAHATQATIDTLRDDATLVDWLGGDPDAIIGGQGSDDVQSRALAVEGVTGGSTQSGQVETTRLTVQLTPLVARSIYRAEPDYYLPALCDRGVAVLRATGIGPGYSYLGTTDDISFPEPQSGSDVDAVMQSLVRVQFAANISESL